eukprot:1936434-Rhodomonas_salina.1
MLQLETVLRGIQGGEGGGGEREKEEKGPEWDFERVERERGVVGPLPGQGVSVEEWVEEGVRIMEGFERSQPPYR